MPEAASMMWGNEDRAMDPAISADTLRCPEPALAVHANLVIGLSPESSFPDADPTSARLLPVSITESFRVMFAGASLGTALLELDPTGERMFLLANPALGEILGVDAEDLLGRDLAEFSDQDDPEDRQTAVEVMMGIRTTSTQRRLLRRPDGRTVWAEIRSHRTELPGLERPTVLVHFVDVTTRHETDEYRARMASMKTSVASIVTQVLKEVPLPEIYQLIADRVARVFNADNVLLGVVDPVTGRFETRGAAGEAATRMLSGEAELSQEFCRRILRLGPLAIAEPQSAVLEGLATAPGPTAAAPFGAEQGGGLITISRRAGRTPFTPTDVELLEALAQQVALAVGIAETRVVKARVALLEERERIARDLHDTVIQDLIAIGMQLDAHATIEIDPVRRAHSVALVDQLEMAVRCLRGSVFDLRDVSTGSSVDDTVRSIAAEASRVLGHLPSVKIEGYLDEVPASVSFSALAVLREALSNVARHAHASTTSIRLSAEDGRMLLIVDDDGCGLPDGPTTGDGLGNVRERASSLNGYATIENRSPGGTRLLWSCPLPADQAPGASEAVSERRP
jgi:PAS domain S-box-containing protein